MNDEFVRTLEDTEQPVLTAAQVAAEVDASVEDAEATLTRLADEGNVDTVEFDGTTAYYVPSQDLPAHKKPDHHCSRCGREVNDTQDSARMELQKRFTGQRTTGDGTSSEILCRFCYHDVVSWLHGDEELMHIYPHLEEWDIPDHQLQAAKDDPDIQTAYPEEN